MHTLKGLQKSGSRSSVLCRQMSTVTLVSWLHSDPTMNTASCTTFLAETSLCRYIQVYRSCHDLLCARHRLLPNKIIGHASRKSQPKKTLLPRTTKHRICLGNPEETGALYIQAMHMHDVQLPAAHLTTSSSTSFFDVGPR